MAIFSTFNPSTMPHGVIEDTFVQREALAERLGEIFEQSAARGSKHNVLLVGPRGIGKSHLVSLVYHRLRSKKTLADRLCIAFLKEDEWGINSFLDLLLRTLRATCEELEIKPPEIFKDLPGLGKPQAEDHAWRCLQGVIGKKTLLLVIENLDSVFAKIGLQGQRQFRALMQTYPQWAVLATTPALFSDIARQVSPFYGFFEVIHLQPLTLADAVTMLRRLAHRNNDEKTEAFLGTPAGRARVRAVQHLAGGNHRIFALFYDFLSQSGSESFIAPLFKTVDALTPYYQSQMVRLSPQQQKIIDFLCEHKKPATVTTIAKGCLTTHQTAASQLKQLLAQRYVRVDRLGRESFYELAEPLMRICVEAKAHGGRPLDLLVDFLRYWFSREELEHKLAEASGHEFEKSYFSAALKGYEMQDAHRHLTPAIGRLCRALQSRQDTAENLRDQAEELVELSRIAEDWSHYARGMAFLHKAEEAIPKLEEILKQDPRQIEILRSLAWLNLDAKAFPRAEELFDRAIELSPRNGMLFLDKGVLLRKTSRNEAALEAFDHSARLEAALKETAAVEKARTLIEMGQFKTASETLSPFLAKGNEISGFFTIYGVALEEEGKSQEALKYFDKALEVSDQDGGALGNKGILLCKMGKYKEGLEALDLALGLDPTSDTLLHYRCMALLKSRAYEEAINTVNEEILSHGIFHEMLDIMNCRFKQGELQQKLSNLQQAHSSQVWQNAFLGGLTEIANLAKSFESREDIDDLETWNKALQTQFVNQPDFSILLKLFDVLTRLKVNGDTKALLELPREQRLLLISNNPNGPDAHN